MKRIVAKLVIAISIGLILGEYFGNKNEIIKYFDTYKKKKEISKEDYDELSYDKLKESHFNYRSFLTYSITTTSFLLLLFFAGDLIRKDE